MALSGMLFCLFCSFTWSNLLYHIIKACYPTMATMQTCCRNIGQKKTHKKKGNTLQKVGHDQMVKCHKDREIIMKKEISVFQ